MTAGQTFGEGWIFLIGDARLTSSRPFWPTDAPSGNFDKFSPASNGFPFRRVY
jgi:hypothetical protein